MPCRHVWRHTDEYSCNLIRLSPLHAWCASGSQSQQSVTLLFAASLSARIPDAVHQLQLSFRAMHNWHTMKACAHTCCICNSAVQDLRLLPICLEECEGAHAEAEATQLLLQHAAAC